MAQHRRSGVVFQPRTYNAMGDGVRQMVRAIRPTLGPVPRYVGIERLGQAPELLDNAGVIARRIVEIADRDADIGAMYLRSVLWRMHEEVGDGTATTAILFEAIFNNAIKYVASGGNAMLLRRNLEAGLHDIVSALDSQVIPVESYDRLEGLALALCHEPDLAELLADAFETSGAEGRIEVRKGQSRASLVEYVPGTYWTGGLIPKQTFADSAPREIELFDPSILISDFEIEDPKQLAVLVPLIEFDKIGSLAIIGMKFSDDVLNMLRFINHRKGELRVVAIKTPHHIDVTRRHDVLRDLGILTGGRVFVGAAGDTFNALNLDDLGEARRVWADKTFFKIVSGKGDPRAVWNRLEELQTRYITQNDYNDQQETLLQISQLRGGTTNVVVGGATERDIEQRKLVVERAVSALRHALRDGIVPGGGIALLNCRTVLREKMSTLDTDQRAAYSILYHALEAPLRTLVHNAGQEWSMAAAQIEQAPAGYGYDVHTSSIVDMVAEGICDIARVTRESVQRAVSGAALLLTTDTLVHKRNPETEYQPR